MESLPIATEHTAHIFPHQRGVCVLHVIQLVGGRKVWHCQVAVCIKHQAVDYSYITQECKWHMGVTIQCPYNVLECRGVSYRNIKLFILWSFGTISKLCVSCHGNGAILVCLYHPAVIFIVFTKPPRHEKGCRKWENIMLAYIHGYCTHTHTQWVRVLAPQARGLGSFIQQGGNNSGVFPFMCSPCSSSSEFMQI